MQAQAIERQSYYPANEFVNPIIYSHESPMPANENNKTSHLKNKRRGVVGSEAFNLNYDSAPTKGELRRDIISYLGEYRLNVQKYHYTLISGRGIDGEDEIVLRDEDRGEPLTYKAKRAIEERTLKGEPLHREEAEEKGLEYLQKQLADAKTGDTIIWASPPGPKEQGYGEYGYLYAGRVNKRDDGEALLAMTAIRIEQPSLAQYNKTLSELSGENISFISAESFIARPKVIPSDIPTEKLDHVLQKNFNFKPDEKQKPLFKAIIERMSQSIEDYILVMQNGTESEKLAKFHVLEHFALDLKADTSWFNEYDDKRKIIYQKVIRLNDIAETYRNMPPPPAVAGSCHKAGGSSGLVSMGGEVSRGIYGSDIYGSRTFNCPACFRVNFRPLNDTLKNCQFCGSDEVAC